MSQYTSVARCPYCRTSFHLGPAELEAARGRVRCGACLNVFDARSHLVIEQKYLFDMDAKSSPTDETRPDPIRRQKHQDPAEPFIGEGANPPNWPDDPDLDLVLGLGLDLAQHDEDEAGNFDEQRQEAFPDPLDQDYPLDDLYEATEDTLPDPLDEDYPLAYFDEEMEEPRPSRLWIAAAAVLLVLIPVQLFWWQPPALLNLSGYSSWLRGQCSWLPCEQLNFQDLTYIRLEGNVQPSAHYQDTLRLYMELSNSGPLPQPLPDIQVSFLDQRGERLSSRVLNPSEYLVGEGIGVGVLRPGQPIQIYLDVYSPGHDFLGYEFRPLLRQAPESR